ncbi:MAG TPA: 7-cyano-7-deazaguanine synthase QueC [Candidatus Acidoferrales bacterium]|nr:7-cyano-7-deazaguanine synthase QueC [Candidatus Acidoferrales bacterium]
MTQRSKAVVLLSGGMDSCVTAAIARTTHDLALVHASYGQRTARRERRAFDEIADFYEVRERLVVQLDHFAQIGGSALTDARIAVPEAASRRPIRDANTAPGDPVARGGEIPVTYVPFRNAHFLSVAVSWAEVIGAHAVFIGAVAEDSSGYPDCRPEYYRVFEELVRVGTRPETHIEIVTPLIGLRKSEIVRRGIELGAPLHLTWSCYQFDDAACGACDSCRLRLAAFDAAGAPDPIAYRAGVAR